jgi:hypothetical protein
MNQQADLASGYITTALSASINSTAGTTAFTTGSAFDLNQILPTVPASDRPTVEAHVLRLQEVVGGLADEQEVLSLMKELGLNRAMKGQKSPTSLFITAHRAFRAPISQDNPVITSLIPIREAIRLVIDHLLKKRPNQEETKTERVKILSIAAHLKWNTIPQETVESWVQQWIDLGDLLSPAKEKDISREDWHFRLRQATLFLRGFLGGLDPDKVNRKSR